MPGSFMQCMKDGIDLSNSYVYSEGKVCKWDQFCYSDNISTIFSCRTESCKLNLGLLIAQNSRLCFQLVFVNGIMLLWLLNSAMGMIDLWLNCMISYTCNLCCPFVCFVLNAAKIPVFLQV